MTTTRSNLPVTLPKGVTVAKSASDLIASFADPEAVLSASIKDPMATAKKYAGLYAASDSAASAFENTKTYAGAYVARILDNAGQGDQIATLLGVKAARVSQYRMSARLIFDFDFVPGAEDTNLLTSRAQNNPEVGKVIRQAAKDAADEKNPEPVAVSHEKIVKALEDYKIAQATPKSSTPKKITASSEKRDDTPILKGNAAKIAEINNLLSALTELSDTDYAALLLVRDSIARISGQTPESVRKSGQALREKMAKKSPTSAA